MARIDKALVAKARERLRRIDFDEEQYSMSTQNFAPPHARSDTPELIDAAGHRYLNIDGLRERGDIVAGFDPQTPNKTLNDQEQIRLNRELELARENEKAQELARLEAEAKAKEESEAKARAEEIAQANAINLENAKKAAEEQAAEYEKKLAEMQAKLDALAKDKAEEVFAATEKKKAPKRKTAKKEEPADVTQGEQGELAEVDDLSEFDQ